MTSPLARSAAEVARAPVPERRSGSISSTVAPAARAISRRAVARAGVDDQDLVDALARERGEQLAEVAGPVLDGDDRCDALGHRDRRRRILPASRRGAARVLGDRNAQQPGGVAISRSGSIRQRSTQ